MKRLQVIAAAGWAVGLAMAAVSISGGFPNITGAFGRDAHAASSIMTEEEAVAAGSDWAAGYFAETAGTSLTRDGAPVVFAEMEFVDARFVADTQKAVLAQDSGALFSEEKDFWVMSWERGSVDNVTTGRPDGTAYLLVVVEDGTGTILRANAGLRQPEEQARARDPLPTFDERFGESLAALEAERAAVTPPAGIGMPEGFGEN